MGSQSVWRFRAREEFPRVGRRFPAPRKSRFCEEFSVVKRDEAPPGPRAAGRDLSGTGTGAGLSPAPVHPVERPS
ncbi:hypothetical protein Msi02_14950 [Microbispora siamensis]|uniref:Uncharacterized protein n=1 Tax=Microbispora siamensis TaxID=564413 RepID=A0ABQ4GGX0_9ACTN|nr:hypothetical protein Msi02_14950 [Microbispora siamensis]